MTKAPSSLQDLRRRIYRKAKTDKTHRFWGLFVHIAKTGTLLEAYRQGFICSNTAPSIIAVSALEGICIPLPSLIKPLACFGNPDLVPTSFPEVNIEKSTNSLLKDFPALGAGS